MVSTIGLGDMFICQSPKIFYASHSLEGILVYAYTSGSSDQISFSWRILSGSNFLHSGTYSSVFIIRPTNERMWLKAIFKVGLVAGLKTTHVRQGQKYLRPRRHSPYKGHLKRQAIHPNPPKWVKAWRDSPLRLEELSSAKEHQAEQPRGTTANRMRPNDCSPPTLFCASWLLTIIL